MNIVTRVPACRRLGQLPGKCYALSVEIGHKQQGLDETTAFRHLLDCFKATQQAEALRSKLATLNATQQSIETVSSYCTFFRKEARKVVSVWEAEFGRTTDMQKKMALLYLANDVLQNSRKRGTHFVVDFYRTLPAATRHMLKHGDAHVNKSVRRVIAIWDERKVFGALGIKPFLEATDSVEATGSGHLPNGKAAAEDAHASTADGIRSLLNSVDKSTAACSSLSQRASPALSQEWVDSTDRGSLDGAGRMLGQYTQALQAEVQQRQELSNVLRGLLAAQDKGVQAAQAQLGQCQGQSSRIDARLTQPSPAVTSGTPADGGGFPPAPSGNPPTPSPSSPQALETLVQDMETYSPTAEAPLAAMGLTPGLQSWGSEGFPYTPSAPPTEYSPFDLPDPLGSSGLPTEQYASLESQPASTTPALQARDPRGGSRDPREGRDPRQLNPHTSLPPPDAYAHDQQQQLRQQEDSVQQPHEQLYSPAADGDMDISTDPADAQAAAPIAAHAEPGAGYDNVHAGQPDVPHLAGEGEGAWGSMMQLPGLAQAGPEAAAAHFSSGASEASQQAPTSAAADIAHRLAAGQMSTEDLLAAISTLPKGSIEGLNL